MNKAFLQRGEELAKKRAEDAANRQFLSADALRFIQLYAGEPQFVKFLHPYEVALTVDMHQWSKKVPVAIICTSMYGEEGNCDPCKETSTIKGRDGKDRVIPNRPSTGKLFIVHNYCLGSEGVEKESKKGNMYTVLPEQLVLIPDNHWDALKKAAKNGSLEKYTYKLEVIQGDGFQAPVVAVQEELDEVITDFVIKQEVLAEFAIDDQMREFLKKWRDRDWQPITDPNTGAETDYHDDPAFSAYRDRIHTKILSSCHGVRWDVIGLENPANKKEESKSNPVTAASSGGKKNTAKDLNKKSDE